MSGALRIHPDPILRETCGTVTEFGAALAALSYRMTRLLYEAEGRGLAAPQIGSTLRVFVMDSGWKSSDLRAPTVFVNPEIVTASAETAVYPEACLSIPGMSRFIARPARVDLRWRNLRGGMERGRFEGMDAAIVQHEIDHLDGILILDHPEARR